MLDGESKKVKEPDIPSVDTDPADEENIPLVWPRFVESLYIVQKPLAPEPVPVSKLAVIKILEDVADGVISTDKVFEAVTKDVDVVDLNVWSVAVKTCKTFPPPKPVAVPELVIVAPLGILIVSPDAPIPSGSSLQVLDGGAKFVVQSGDALKVVSDTASSLDVWVSAVDAIST